MPPPTDFADAPERKYGAYYTVLIIAFVVLLARLWHLQVIQGSELQERSKRQLIRKYRIPAARGIIRDRNGLVLAENRPSFNLVFHPKWLSEKHRRPFLDSICRRFEIDLKVAMRRLDASRGRRPFKIKTDITREEAATIETEGMRYGPRYPLEIEVESLRVYPKGKLAAHLMGYCAEIDKERLESPRYSEYRPGDLVGKTGVEEHYEEYLAGRIGRKTVEVDARNVPIRVLNLDQGKPGRDITLNIDAALSAVAARAMGKMAGAVVVLDPRDGSVLVAHSSPSFSPEMFSRPISHQVWQALITNKKKPLRNKMIQGLYPPGSAFKVVTALAGLESGVIRPKDTIYCSGKWKFGGRNFRCHKEKGHGLVNLHFGIVRSCDVYFYKKGFEMGIEVLSEYGRALGLGEKIGIDLPGEKGGNMPDREWKMKVKKERWLPGDTLNSAIGQGYTLSTPLQIAVLYAAIANGGTVFRPQVVRRIVSQSGEVIQEFQSDILRTLPVSPGNLERIRRALIDVVNSPAGTGGKARIKGVVVAGKTGTSQVRSLGKVRRHISLVEYGHRDHAWFACFAPAEDPTVVVVVLAEHEGHGGLVAAPVARLVLEAYFRNQKRLNVQNVL